MEPSPTEPDSALLDGLRRRRAELRESMNALEHALAAPARADPGQWAERVHVALVELTADLREHIDVTEGEDGLYRDVLATAPRLSEAVTRLTREHGQLAAQVENLLAHARSTRSVEDVNRARDLGTALLGTLVRHRQRGSDLVYEAYEVDVGGET